MKNTATYFFLFLLFIPLQLMSQYAENDWEERDSWMPLEAIFEEIQIKEGQAIADIGCHEGYLTLHLANRLGKTGKVFAVDVRADRLETLRGILKAKSLYNVDVILGDYDNPRLPEQRLDIVFIMDTYHEMEDYETILSHVKASLKPGGKLVIIEKLKARIRGKTRTEQTDAHSLSIKYVKEELIEAGFSINHEDHDMGDWENDEEKVIWMLIAKKI